MALKSKWQIQTVSGSASSIYLWKITNLLNGDINYFPVSLTNLTLQVSSATDYNFIWNKDELHSLQLNIIDVLYIGTSGAPAYNNSAADLAAILALI